MHLTMNLGNGILLDLRHDDDDMMVVVVVPMVMVMVMVVQGHRELEDELWQRSSG